MNNDKQPTVFLWENIIKRKGYFYISNKTLEQIRLGYLLGHVYISPKWVAFERLLEVEKLVVVKLSNELSVIKKVV